jgi:hypothetical protein
MKKSIIFSLPLIGLLLNACTALDTQINPGTNGSETTISIQANDKTVCPPSNDIKYDQILKTKYGFTLCYQKLVGFEKQSDGSYNLKTTTSFNGNKYTIKSDGFTSESVKTTLKEVAIIPGSCLTIFGYATKASESAPATGFTVLRIKPGICS